MRNFYNIRTKKAGLFGSLTADFPIPKDKGILLKDIIENGYVEKDKSQALLESEAKTYGYKDMAKFTAMIKRRKAAGRQLSNMVFVDRDKARAILESESRPLSDSSKMYRRYKSKGFGNLVYQVNPSKESGGKQPYQHNRVYADYGKISTLTESQSARVKIAYEELEKDGIEVRILTKTELCRLQGFPDDYCDILSRNQAGSVLGDGWTLPVIKHFFQFIKSHPNYKDRLWQKKRT